LYREQRALDPGRSDPKQGRHWSFPRLLRRQLPKGQVHPAALGLLQELGYPTIGFRSKSWDEFAATEAPELDFIFTVCDDAAGEACSVWPGHPMTAHWGIPDPAAAPPEMQERAFRDSFFALQSRIRLFLALPLESIGEMSLQNRLRKIGQTKDAESPVG